MIHLTDFSDRLSPMLVKELRQGMRARSFTIVFLGFQCLLAFVLLTAGASFESDGAGVAASGTIFTMFSIVVLFIQPMRGVAALSSEITGKTIEMISLTRLTAWRIVFGKWIAIVSQSALILVTIIPYLILRYFFGGMNLLGEVVLLSLIFLTSMALTALMVGFSTSAGKLARSLPILVIVFGSQYVPFLLYRGGSGMSMSFFTFSDAESIITISCYLVFIAYVGWCALSHGTASIAPVAENHSTVRRLIALGLAVITATIAFTGYADGFAIAMAFAIILTPALMTAFTEPAIVLPPVCKPFLKRGKAGRVAAAFLLPGWPTGVFYAGLMALIGFVGITGAFEMGLHSFDEKSAIVCLSCFGSLLLPALLAAIFTKQDSKRFTNFMIFLVVSICLAVTAMILTNIKSNNETYLWAFIWNPPVFLFMLSNGRFDADNLLLAVSLIDSALFLALLGIALKGYREYGRVFQQTDAALAREVTTAHAGSDAA